MPCAADGFGHLHHLVEQVFSLFFLSHHYNLIEKKGVLLLDGWITLSDRDTIQNDP